jgi:hypothetical protein
MDRHLDIEHRSKYQKPRDEKAQILILIVVIIPELNVIAVWHSKNESLRFSCS